ncbi:MAG TPA: hypothetical protein VMP08_26080 [Anaerolineae bacterium]|nr:hypothetical protein [Anaerolineae bacterium]
MALDILQVEYYNITVEDQITTAATLLSTIAAAGVDFHAFKAIPVEPNRTQFTLFAKDSSKLTAGAKKSGLELAGPYSALFIKGDEKAGALADIYKKLSQAGIQVGEACGIADINAGYGVILYLEQDDCGKAMTVLNM